MENKLSNFEEIGYELGKLVTEKNKAYGNSFDNSIKIFKVLFPDGVPVEKYGSLLTMARVIDKLFRIATQKDAFGESPWRDIAGYALLELEKDERQKESLEPDLSIHQ